MNISDTINIILSVLSFVLALISVVTVIITLRQNGKMIKIMRIKLQKCEMNIECHCNLYCIFLIQNIV